MKGFMMKRHAGYFRTQHKLLTPETSLANQGKYSQYSYTERLTGEKVPLSCLPDQTSTCRPRYLGDSSHVGLTGTATLLTKAEKANTGTCRTPLECLYRHVNSTATLSGHWVLYNHAPINALLAHTFLMFFSKRKRCTRNRKCPIE